MKHQTRRFTPKASHRSGFMLIEVLVALALFSFGVLGLIALQSKAVTQSMQAQSRATAAYLANELLGQMNLTDKATNTLTTQFSSVTAGAGYLAWKGRVETMLPGASNYAPVVTVTTIDPLPNILGNTTGPADPELRPSSRVSIQLRWKHPSESSSAPASNLQVITELK